MFGCVLMGTYQRVVVLNVASDLCSSSYIIMHDLFTVHTHVSDYLNDTNSVVIPSWIAAL